MRACWQAPLRRLSTEKDYGTACCSTKVSAAGNALAEGDGAGVAYTDCRALPCGLQRKRHTRESIVRPGFSRRASKDRVGFDNLRRSKVRCPFACCGATGKACVLVLPRPTPDSRRCT